MVLTGPTASGKGAVVFELARRLGASVASMDSMKVYREMDVVTAKPDAERRARCEYHLIDVVDPDVDFSVGEYVPLLDALLARETDAGRPVIVCGGTALYVKAFVEGLGDVPAANWELRDRLKVEVRQKGLAALYQRLREVDPRAAEKFLPEDERRIVRALEVWETTGKRMSESWDWGSEKAPSRRDDVRLVGLHWERPDLYARTDLRVLRMVEKGLFDEAERLIARDPPLGRSARQCIGHKEIRDGIENGRSRQEIVATIQQNTRNFVKRQMTWFRKMEIEWIPCSGELDPVAVAERILAVG
jgi:tRNA dimethylallyltransferase